MKRSILVSLWLCAVALVPHVLFGQSNTPESVVQEYHDALFASDWGTLADLMHPDALEEIAVLVKDISEMNETTKKSMDEQFAGYFSSDTLDRVDPRTIYMGFMNLLMGQAMVDMVMGGTSAQVIGSVAEGKDTAHVIIRYRMSLDDGETFTNNLEVQSAQLYNGKWMLLLDERIASLRSMLPLMLGMTKVFENLDDDDSGAEEWNEEEESWEYEFEPEPQGL